MKLTTKGRYAVTAMLDLALNNDSGPVTLADISTRQSISLSYLEQLFSRLRKKGLVVSTRGPGGGYNLARSASSMPVGEVVDAVDEQVDATRCGGAADCHNHQRCLTHDLWTELSEQIRDYLMRVTLGDLMEREGVRAVADRQAEASEHQCRHEFAGAVLQAK
jgi:Rrf2 family transcriptional regulator, iron-sulfur cluster assembly transcription factor